MSAFMVEDSVINSVIAYLAHGRNIDHIRTLIFTETGCDLRTADGCEKLGVAMFQLNIEGVEARYGKGEAAEFRELDHKFRSELPPTAIQAYKSLGCWHYQCSEGELPESNLFYATMERVSSEIAHEIVRSLPAYEKARW